MLIQVVEGLTKVVELITSSEKLADQRQKKLVGRRLVELHEQLSRVADSAIDIERYLKNILYELEASKFLSQLDIQLLNVALECQAAHLHHLDKLLKDQTMFQFIQLYDEVDHENPLYRAIRAITDDKGSIITVLCLLIERTDSNVYILPTTFDVRDLLGITRKGEDLIEDYQRYGNCHTHLLWRVNRLLSDRRTQCEIQQEGRLTIPSNSLSSRFQETNTVNQEELLSNIKITTNSLLEQILEANISQKLLEAKNQLGAMIRSKFTVEDLF